MSDDTLERSHGSARVPIDGTLDLHAFAPADVKSLVRDYVVECRRLGILEIRLIHGKGTGALRETVHSVLRGMPEVASFKLDQGGPGGWGATVAKLRP